MRALSAREVRDALLSKGFFLDKRPRDHEMYILSVDGKKSDFFFKISRGAAEVRKDEIAHNARQIRVPPSELFSVVSCSYDAQATRELHDRRPPRSGAR
jgi:hypothetical protein